MYIGIDIGGTKTLIASFYGPDKIENSIKISTPKQPEELVDKLLEASAKLREDNDIVRIGLAGPGSFHEGLFTNTTTLGWHDIPLIEMIQKKLNTQVLAHNDAVLGGLAEARIGNGQNCIHLLYVTISTGVGTGIITNGAISKSTPNSEGGLILIGKSATPRTIQDRISGKAFKSRFGAYGYEIDDPQIWDEYASDLALALFDMSALIEPDKIVLGGGMSLHFTKFKDHLARHLDRLGNAQIIVPEIDQAKFPELAVIHGCAILAIEGFSNE